MKTVFFTGHRTVNYDREVFKKYKALMIELIKNGATDFYVGGTKGWDMMFASTVLNLRENHVPLIKLHLVLPCPPEEQTARWNVYDKQNYWKILEEADSVEIVSEHYSRDCMKKRNKRLAELGEVCVCCYDEKMFHSGTGQTVRLAEKKEKKIINILKL